MVPGGNCNRSCALLQAFDPRDPCVFSRVPGDKPGGELFTADGLYEQVRFLDNPINTFAISLDRYL